MSNLTLSLLEDSGWYKVNRTFAEHFLWGKDEGCQFPVLLCKSSQNFSEFCIGNGQGCTQTGVFKGECR